MRICDICCKEIENSGGWRIKKGKVEDYCDRCKEWLMNDYELQGNEENARRIVKELRMLMDERRDNLEKLQEYVTKEIALRISRKERGEEK